MLKQYIRDLYETAKTGDAREESFYGDLETLLESYSAKNDLENLHITTLPKQTEAGNPDFRVWDGQQKITGYIEAKKPSTDKLNRIENSEQLQRYRSTFPNLILTNFFEFRLYREGKLVDKVSIGREYVLTELNEPPPLENREEFLELMDKFFSFSLPKTYSAESLASELAKKTKFLRDEVLKEELKGKESKMHSFHKAFQEYLIGGISEEEFADLYAQTITYGLFAARTRSKEEFNRKLAYDKIPHTIGILRDVFRYISMEEPPEQMEWIVDDISEVLATTDVNQLLRKYFHEGKGSDPVVHFYETFLAEYDPSTREQRGVYYTPEPVVSYIVRSVNKILKENFDKEDGLATSSVKVLDPAGGTLTFIAKAIQLTVEEFTEKYGAGAKEGLIKDHIIEDYYSFELMMAPYAVGHLKMSFLLDEYGYQLGEDERFKLYLTNTLEKEKLEEQELPFMSSLSEESRLAQEVKEETPILAIIGNPPYSGYSANTGDWIQSSLKEGYSKEDGTERQGYYEVDGEPLGEKNPKWLQDDYVKFIRFGQWKIDQSGEGILAFITNHSYLDNPTFRGMRQSLMETFDQIYFLDLHGNSLKREKCPDGSKDENVFDIRQGVSIALFVKNDDLEDKICHSNLWGLREEKYNWLSSNSVETTDWEEINPISSFYLFKPRDQKLLDQYQNYPKVTDIFPLNGVGMTTARDNFVIDFDKEKLLNRIRRFKNSDFTDDELHDFFDINRKKVGQYVKLGIDYKR